MAKFYFLGSNVLVTSSVTDNTGAPITPDAISVAVTDPTGASVTVTSPVSTGTGTYKATISPVTVAGVYTVTWSATAASFIDVGPPYTFTVLGTAPIVSLGDLGIYLGNPNIDPDRATLILAAAQSLCESVVSPLPNGAYAVVLDVAARGMVNPTNAQQQTDGPFSVSYGSVAGGLWLTNSNKATLRNLAGQVGAFTIETMPATAGQGLSWWDYGYPAPYGDWDAVPS